MRLGLGSYTYVWAVGVPGHPPPKAPLTPLDLLAKAARLGVRLVQIADNLPLHDLRSHEIDAIRSRADELGIELELGTAGIDRDHLRHYLLLAGRLRARVLRTVIDSAKEQPATDAVVARLRPIVPELERAGVVLALENHDRFKATVLRDIVTALRSRSVGVCLDTANSLGCMEGPDHVLDVLGPYVVNLHVKDVRVFRPAHLKGFVVEGRPAGRGQLDVPALLTRLRDMNVNPNAILELWPPPEPTIDAAVAKEDAWADESVRYLRTLIPD